MTYRARSRQRRHASKRGKIFLGAMVALAGAIIGAMSIGLWALDVAARAPSLGSLEAKVRPESTEVLAADGSRLGYIPAPEIRVPVRLERIPELLQQATIAIEDERFYDHNGVDLEAIGRAAWENFSAGETRQGGSTITQQLVRNLYLRKIDDSIERKIKEAKLAEQLEEEQSKAWILEEYLNTASYGTLGGQTMVGVQAASQVYFSKPAKDLTLREAALIAGMPQAPSEYNPVLAPNAALKRRNEVLDSMARLGFISASSATEAKSSNLGIEIGDRYTKVKEPFFFNYVKQELEDRYGAETVRKGGLTVYTTIDPKLQDLANQVIANRAFSGPGNPDSALTSTNVKTGEILAMASSRPYAEDQFNLASQGQRQPGSSFKPFVLTTAIKQGADPDNTYYSGTPTPLDIGGTAPWNPQNSAEGEGGTMSLRQATVNSVNVVYAKLGLDVGNENVTETAQDMGITSDLFNYPAEAIGGLTDGVTTLEMSNAYATLANGGVHHRAHGVDRVKFPDGEVDRFDGKGSERAFSDGIAYEVTNVLEGVTGGTAPAADYGCPMAGKTGTTDKNTDAWFVGYNPKLSTAVWTGFPDSTGISLSPYAGGFGGTLSAPIWHDFMVGATNGYCEPFPSPTESVSFTPFYGEHSASGSSSSSSTDGDYQTPPSDESTTTTPDEGSGPVDDEDSGAYAPGILDPSDKDR